jgi:DNA-binding NarL/FixJ family response regulator
MNPPNAEVRPKMSQEIRLFVLESTAMSSGRVAARVCSQEGISLLGRAKMHRLIPERIHAVSPDVLLMDTGMAVGENLPVLRHLRAHHPRLPLAVAVQEQEADAVVAYFQGGAKACIPPDASAQDALTALRRAQQGEVACSPIVVRFLVRRLRESAPSGVGQETHLSSREKEVLWLIADGLLNKQIAGRLGIALCTVKNHTHNILKKLQVRRRRDAIDYAYRSGILRRGAPTGRHVNAVGNRLADVLLCERHFP